MRIITLLTALCFLTSCTSCETPVQTVVVNGRVVTQQVPAQKPQGNAGDVRIVWVIPNTDAEVFSIGNFSNSPVDVRGWILKDLKSWTWKLDSLGSLPARTQRILYSDQRQLVNNTGDTLFLINAQGVEVHRFGFGATQRGDTVKAP